MGTWYDVGGRLATSKQDINQTWTFFMRCPIQPPITASMLRFRVVTAPAGARYRLGIYSDVASLPSALLAQTADFAVAVGAAQYEIALAGSVVLTTDYVWIARQVNNNTSFINETGSDDPSVIRTDRLTGGYAAGFPAVVGALNSDAEAAWCGLFTEAHVTANPQGCYFIEYSTDNINWVDVSGFANSIRTPRRSRRFSETQPQATDTPIVSMGKRIAERVTIEVLYTEADGMVFNALRQRFENNELLMLRWAPTGGAVGDYNFTTDATYSYIVDMEVPGANARNSAEPLIATFTVITQDVTQGVV